MRATTSVWAAAAAGCALAVGGAAFAGPPTGAPAGAAMPTAAQPSPAGGPAAGIAQAVGARPPADAARVATTPADLDALWEVAPAPSSRGEARPARGGLTASQLQLRRLPAGDASAVPMTHQTTQYADWSVACEMRDGDKACFASTYAEDGVDGPKVKLKFGLAEPPAPPAPEAGPPGKGGKVVVRVPPPARPRYVMSVEAPPDLDPAVGVAVVAGSSAGVLDMSHGCDRGGCRATMEVGADLAPVVRPDEGGGMTLMASTAGRALQWRFRTDGLAEAFRRVREETEPREAPAKVVATVAPAAPPSGRPGARVAPSAATMRSAAGPLAIPADAPAHGTPAAADAGAAVAAAGAVVVASAGGAAAPEPAVMSVVGRAPRVAHRGRRREAPRVAARPAPHRAAGHAHGTATARFVPAD